MASFPGDQLFHAFLWKDGVKTDLGTLEGDSTSDAHGINSKGQVVGSSENGPSSRGFLWENGKMFDLNTLVSPGSKLNLYFPTIINDRGEIAGQGQLPNGDIHAFLLIPCDESHRGHEDCEEAAGSVTAAGENSLAPASQSPVDVIKVGLTRREIATRIQARFGRGRGFLFWPRK